MIKIELNSFTMFYTSIILVYCSGFVVTLSNSNNFNFNEHLFSFKEEKVIFNWKSGVFLNEISNTDFGFLLRGKVIIDEIFRSKDTSLLRLELQSSQLEYSDSSDARSNLNFPINKPFLISINDGIVESVFIDEKEDKSLKNLKKGLASLFQFQPWKRKIQEIDASGKCNVIYKKVGSFIQKIKSDCFNEDIDDVPHLDKILGVNRDTKIITEYNIDKNAVIQSIKSTEIHKINLEAKSSDFGSFVKTEQSLVYENSMKNTDDHLKFTNFDEALSHFVTLTKNDLSLDKENSVKNVPSFGKLIEKLKNDLNEKNMGSLKSAKIFLPLLESAKISSSAEISKVLKSQKNDKILPQIYDILGYTQTENSHSAVMKHLHLDQENHLDLIERYLWALSFSIHPNLEIMEDLLNKYKKYTKIPEKIEQTLVLTLASIARKAYNNNNHQFINAIKIHKEIEDVLINGLDYSKDSNRRHLFLNALKTLQSPSTLPIILQIIKNGTLKEEVFAWRAIKSFKNEYFTEEILKQAEKTLFQLDKKHDTSSRTLALDILLETEISDETVKDLLNFVASNSTSDYEVKQYVWQNIKLLAEKCRKFNNRVMNNIIKKNPKLNNYSSLSPKGLSTALERSIFKGASINGSLISIQEIKSGIVKRGVVDIKLSKNEISKELFTLGIFASGLSSFTSHSAEEEEENNEEETTTTAGLELTVLSTQLRPFIFFEGNGELMGHVWSGTASKITPAFQAFILVQDHKEYLRLGNGFIVDIDLKGIVSFDLSGKIEISIWSRNAQSLIRKSAGLLLKGNLNIETSFAKINLELEESIEPKLTLEIDADFYDNVKLCMRLTQPDSEQKTLIMKNQIFTQSSSKNLRKTTKRKMIIPGFTYALNRKNSEMCNTIFN